MPTYDEVFVDVEAYRTSILIDSTTAQDDRPPLFVVGLSSHYHDKFSAVIHKTYRIVLLDLYWTDRQFNPRYIENLTMDDLVRHIEIVRQQLQECHGDHYQKIFLVGHSAYGLIALSYSLAYPSHVYGLITMGTPLTFDPVKLQRFQERYLELNFAKTTGEALERYQEYYKNQAAFTVRESEPSKNYFVDWYCALGPLLWKNKKFWKDEHHAARNIWNPWAIRVNHASGDITTQTRDIYMDMMFRCITLIQKEDWPTRLAALVVPTLWIIGIYDCRVSLIHLEAMLDEKKAAENIEYYYSDHGHWPMFQPDGNTVDLDQKLKEWRRLA